jgi:oxygen-independent coproporphyrinogen-3 oxidase
LIDDYVETVCREITALRSTFYAPLSTIFFGGGTPTLLEPAQIGQILKNIESRKSSVEHREISIEANPGTADARKLRELRQLGINRLSIGVQSFNDQHLKTLGRIHDSKTAKQFYRDARTAGFDNINLDLIFALPGQTLAEWEDDLRTAIKLGPEHLSTYNLQIEENTPFALSPTNYPLLPNEDLQLAMYENAIETLTAVGYKHYEISNFAKPGRECQHNLVYWRNGNYLGVGAGAHSHWNGQRWANPNCIETYIGGAARNVERITTTDSSRATDRRETLFLGLRLLDGLAKEKFSGFEKEAQELIKDGLLEDAGNNYRLTRKGLYLGNEVFARFV